MVYEGTHKQFTTFINNLVLPEDERSRGRMMETETRVLMETKPWRAMTSKKLELQVNNSLRQRELTETKPTYIPNVYLPINVPNITWSL